MEKGNRKGKGQKSYKNQNPQPKKQRGAVLTFTPDEECKVDIKTGKVSDLEMYMFLRDMTHHFAKTICDDASEVVGDNSEEQIKYLNWRIDQSGLNG